MYHPSPLSPYGCPLKVSDELPPGPLGVEQGRAITALHLQLATPGDMPERLAAASAASQHGAEPGGPGAPDGSVARYDLELLPLSVRYRATVDLLHAFAEPATVEMLHSLQGSARLSRAGGPGGRGEPWGRAGAGGIQGIVTEEALGLITALCVHGTKWPGLQGSAPRLEVLPQEVLSGGLDDGQQKAANMALGSALCLVEGGRRCGKSTVAVAVAHSFAAHSLQGVAADGRREAPCPSLPAPALPAPPCLPRPCLTHFLSIVVLTAVAGVAVLCPH